MLQASPGEFVDIEGILELAAVHQREQLFEVFGLDLSETRGSVEHGDISYFAGWVALPALANE